MIRQTHTYAELEVSAVAYDEISGKLKAADYGHAFMSGEDVNGHPTIDMQGIGLTRLPAPVPTGPPQEVALETVRAIAAAHGGNNGESVHRMVIRMLAVMWANEVRAEWQAYVDADPELKAQHAVAKELMREDGYTMEIDPVCMLPGTMPQFASIDGKQIACIDYSMGQVTPLSAIYVNKVRIVQSAAARAAKALAEEAVKAPPEWPLTIASGETFNSIEEMEQCPIEAVREMAKMMRDAAARDAAPLPGLVQPRTVTAGLLPTCWQYFGFDGPVSMDDLRPKYIKVLQAIPITGTQEGNKLAAEAHRQYQNCLRELGAALDGGGVDAEEA